MKDLTKLIRSYDSDTRRPRSLYEAASVERDRRIAREIEMLEQGAAL